MYASDADVATTYPVAEIINNLDKENTVSEPCRIRGLDGTQMRVTFINLTGGRVNALEILQTVCKMPPLDDWLEEYDRSA